MNIKENDIFIECTHFKIEVHVWTFKKMIFLKDEFSLKSKNMDEF